LKFIVGIDCNQHLLFGAVMAIDCNQWLLLGAIGCLDLSFFVHKMWMELLIAVSCNFLYKNPPKRAAKKISTVKNHLFLVRLPIFRNKVAVFSFIFIS
jgi:hypothetical protein